MTTATPDLTKLGKRHPIVADANWRCKACGFQLVTSGGHFVHSEREIRRVRESVEIGFPRP